MQAIDNRTLVLAIVSLDFKIADLERELDVLDPERISELELLLLDYDNAAEALKRMYLEALKEVDNLPPYGSLVRSAG